MPTILICFLFLMFGCATVDGVKQPPPSPFEAKILAQTIMGVGIHSQKLPPNKIEKLMQVMKDGRGIVQLAMVEDPTRVEPITLSYVKGLDPVYQEVTKGMLQVFIIRLRPYTQAGGDPTLAATYIDAVFDGAILACEQALGIKPAPVEDLPEVQPA
jgi:hypothetical protein